MRRRRRKARAAALPTTPSSSQAKPTSPAPATRVRPRLLAFCAIALLGAAAYFWFIRSAEKSSHQGASDSARGATAQPKFIGGRDVGYTEPAACVPCHSDVQETYQHTGMGRAFYAPRRENTVEDYSRDNTYYHKASDRYYTMEQRGGSYYVRRYQTGPDGKPTNVLEKRIDYVIGSGNHSRSYLARTADGQFIQLPISWYSEKGGYWAMSPGYDRPDHQGFLRRVDPGCIFCHNGYPEIEERSDLIGGKLVYPEKMPEGIDCQRCHGPGREHIRATQSLRPDLETVRASIVNPGRLDPERQMEVCMQCHLETTVRALPHGLRRHDRGAFSYRPGEPLADYMLHFSYPKGAGHDDTFEIAHAAYRLRKSACFQATGTITCTTCHNPHDVKRGEEAERAYIGVCRICHGAEFDRLVSAGRHVASRECLDCHMPKRRTDDVVHAVMTDHYIQRRKPARDLLAPLTEVHETPETKYQGEVVLYYPATLADTPENELHLAVAQVKTGSNLQGGIPRLEKAIEKHQPQEAYFHYELAEAYARAGRSSEAVSAYEQALRREPSFSPALSALGGLLAKTAREDRAVTVLQRALELHPNSFETLNDLALAYLNQGNRREAIAALREMLRISPDSPQGHVNLGGALYAEGDVTGAENSFREAIRLQPDHVGAHNNLANLLRGQENFEGAKRHFETTLALDPGYTEARYNYGRMLMSTGFLDQARAQFEKVVQLQPDLAEAHDELGTVLVLQGETAAARRAYQRAIERKPDFAEAQFNLGALLLREGKPAEAKQHFENAVRSNPRLFAAHLNLGNQFAVEGDYGRAKIHFQKVLQSSAPTLRQAAAESLQKLAEAGSSQ